MVSFPETRPPFLDFFFSPLVAITAAQNGNRSGLIAGMSLLVSPLPGRERFAVAVWKQNYTHGLIAGSQAFALHVLDASQDELVYSLGISSGRDVDKIGALSHEIGETGAPLLTECLAVYDCRVMNQIDGGEMTLFLGESVGSNVRRSGMPLWRHDLLARMPPERKAAYDANRLATSALDAQLRETVLRCICASGQT